MDKEIIEIKIEYIKDTLLELKDFLTEYETTQIQRQKRILKAALERKTEEIIETAITINQELLKTKNKISQSYYDSFIDLKIFKTFDEDFLNKIASTTGFRNRLAHDYMNLNDIITIKSIKKVLKLYPKYLLKCNSIL